MLRKREVLRVGISGPGAGSRCRETSSASLGAGLARATDNRATVTGNKVEALGSPGIPLLWERVLVPWEFMV